MTQEEEWKQEKDELGEKYSKLLDKYCYTHAQVGFYEEVLISINKLVTMLQEANQ
jgi:hypothetical protein